MSERTIRSAGKLSDNRGGMQSTAAGTCLHCREGVPPIQPPVAGGDTSQVAQYVLRTLYPAAAAVRQGKH